MLALPSFIDVEDERGRTALQYAAQLDNLESVELLVKQNANVNITDDLGRTALHVACRNGNVKMVNLLLEHQADVKIPDKLGYTAIHEAVRSGNSKLFATLFDKSRAIRPIPIFHIKKVKVYSKNCCTKQSGACGACKVGC
jgi:26S proteasome non-ATPase regulatory subunit 10